ncbi:MAG TPA: hypothetical protein VFB62_26350 [Polyangiaceae bacterium]|jgi:hypothetical protein|nr:hypothetical protein [Polyangiaceae bacterium]
MHRPTRQHRNLKVKLARKEATSQKLSRKAGKKHKRWKKSLSHYEALCKDHSE